MSLDFITEIKDYLPRHLRHVSGDFRALIKAMNNKNKELEEKIVALEERLQELEDAVRYAPGGFEFQQGQKRWDETFQK